MLKATPIRIACLCTLLAAVALALPQPAQASDGHERCVNVAPPGEFCRRCVDVGYYTGACCTNIGACGCIYVECPGSFAASSSEVTAEELLFAAELTPTAEAEPAAGPAPELPAAESGGPAAPEPAAD